MRNLFNRLSTFAGRVLNSDLPRYIRLDGEPLFVNRLNAIVLRRDFQAAAVFVACNTIVSFNEQADPVMTTGENALAMAVGYYAYRNFCEGMGPLNIPAKIYGQAFFSRCFDTRPDHGVMNAVLTPIADLSKASGALSFLKASRPIPLFVMYAAMPYMVISAAARVSDSMLGTDIYNYIKTDDLSTMSPAARLAIISFATIGISYSAHTLSQIGRFKKVLQGDWAIVPVSRPDDAPALKGPPGMGMA